MSLRVLFILAAIITSGLFGKVGGKAPRGFVLPDLETKEHLLFKEYIGGKKVILNFFASYCLPCKEEIPEIQNLVSKYPNVKLIFINIDESSEIPKLESLVKEWGIKHPVLLDSYQVAINQYAKSKVAVPATIIIDAKGRIRFESVGYEKDTIQKMEKVLKKL